MPINFYNYAIIKSPLYSGSFYFKIKKIAISNYDTINLCTFYSYLKCYFGLGMNYFVNMFFT